MLKLRCTLPNLVNICLHKPTDANLYPFTERDRPAGENARNLCWWPFYRFHTQNGC